MSTVTIDSEGISSLRPPRQLVYRNASLSTSLSSTSTGRRPSFPRQPSLFPLPKWVRGRNSKTSTASPPDTQSGSKTSFLKDRELCTSCLRDLSSEEPVVEFKCGHHFHEKCGKAVPPFLPRTFSRMDVDGSFRDVLCVEGVNAEKIARS